MGNMIITILLLPLGHIFNTFNIKNSVFIIYLLEDEQGLSLGMLIRLRRIYNFLLFHAFVLSILDVLYAFIRYFISFLATSLLTQCLVPVAVFCLFLVFQKISTKRSPNATKLFDDFFSRHKIPWKLWDETRWQTRSRQGNRARPGG
jgi:hypothetical protein